MSLSRTLIPALLLATLAGCGDGDPLAQDVADYHARVTPTLQTNQSMSQQFLELTQELKGNNISSDEIAQRWEQQIVPQADELKNEVFAIEPQTAELQDLHSQLTFSWSERAEAYHQMLDAFKGNQPDKFKKAFDRNLKAKLTEEQYFNQVNVLLQPYDLQLTPYQ